MATLILIFKNAFLTIFFSYFNLFLSLVDLSSVIRISTGSMHTNKGTTRDAFKASRAENTSGLLHDVSGGSGGERDTECNLLGRS